MTDEVNSQLTSEYIIENNLNFVFEDDVIWKFIEAKTIDYDEGNVTDRYVYQNRNTNEFWAFDYVSNSWAEWHSSADDIKPFRVEPKEVTRTEYVRIKK